MNQNKFVILHMIGFENPCMRPYEGTKPASRHTSINSYGSHSKVSDLTNLLLRRIIFETEITYC